MNKLRFLHIPKTAGTTFSNILIDQYGKDKYFQFTGDIDNDLERFDSLPKGVQANTVLFTGHAPVFTGHDYVDTIDLVTFLRDPVERVKSFCQHVSEGKSKYLVKLFPPENFNLQRLLNSQILELRNLQTKMLTNKGRCALRIQMRPQEAIDKAFLHLTEKTTFGLVEYFDESLILFQKKYKWELPTYYSKNRKNTDKLIEFKPHHIDRIKQLNALDIELYEKAKSYFMKQLQSDDFDNDKLAKLQKSNKYKTTWQKIKNKLSLKS
ncbi:MAG: sulfotransferase family 2 domain-containing protein [Marinicellaceae bacterium]